MSDALQALYEELLAEQPEEIAAVAIVVGSPSDAAFYTRIAEKLRQATVQRDEEGAA